MTMHWQRLGFSVLVAALLALAGNAAPGLAGQAGRAQGAGEDADELPPVVYPAIPAKVENRSALVPPGWTIDAEASGDLDGDRRPDLALVIRSQTPDLTASGKPLVGPRMLIVAFAANGPSPGRNAYERVAVNHRFIPRSNNGEVEDCFHADEDALSITGGKLVLTLNFFASAGSWSTWSKTYTFGWQNGTAMLERFASTETDRSSGEMLDTVADYRTRRLTLGRGTIESDALKTRTSRLHGPVRVSLEGVGSGMDFEPVAR
jgi:hypothetical protein